MLPIASRWPETGLYATWLGHSTVLIKADGVTILTDPIFSKRAGLNLGPVTLGVKRLAPPALKLRELPKIDAIVLSHAHMDHFDLPSLRALKNRDTAVFTASKTGDLLKAARYREVHELAWGESVETDGIAVRAFEVNHWGARMRSDTYRGYNGYVIDAGRYRILFGGDTAMTDSFANLKSRRGIDLGIMPIGAYNPWIRFHCTPEQAWRMGNDAGAEFLLPVHHQTFQLSREPYTEPIERFHAAAGSATNRIALSAIGQEFHL
ncbi:MAG: hypothetical protein JWO80_106 [Bryobacterales bacterium]|nr:hypothetical protein [Bryobacterales bacterium]